MEKINIAELLRDCPTGMELDSPIIDNLHFDCVTDDNIKCYVISDICGICNIVYFKHDGSYLSHHNAKCVIFPKGKTTWEGFQRPFKDGDVVYVQANYEYIAIYKDLSNEYLYEYAFVSGNRFQCDSTPLTHRDYIRKMRLATEEEKQKLFDAIKANGYKWNAETKTLEKLKVNKFDITTLKPFESRVLVRTNNGKWVAAFYSHYDKDSLLHHCVVGGLWYEQCVPYNGNGHLLGTTDDCDDYYKTWE